MAEFDAAIEEAGSGTLYLEEIEALPVKAQARLQDVLDGNVGGSADGVGRQSDLRIIASSSGDLIERVAQSAFREELFYSLAVLVLKVPPLRERTGDLGPLIELLMRAINNSMSKVRANLLTRQSTSHRLPKVF